MMKRALLRLSAGVLATGLAVGTASAQAPANLPEYLAIISGNTPSTPSDVATRDLLQLDIGMFSLYDRASTIYRRNILAKHPIILAMFTNQGGNLMLFRPNQPPVTAPSVPKVYQILKSTGHSTMALSQVVIPSVNNAADKRWIAPMAAYRVQMKTALDGLDASNDIQADWKPAVKEILANNVAYMDDCLAKGVVTLDGLTAFAKKQGPNIKLIINWAASTQVKHWMGVMDEWSAMLGPDMAKTYAASNTIYVARQNNVLFSVLAQYFGPEAINDRLMLIETMGFTTTPDEMLVAMTRIIGDRSVGELFFGNYKIMDFELMGGDGRKTIISEMQRRGKQPFLPPAVPFGSKQWPTLITTGPGPTSLDDLK
jgi:Tfp pilus assembly protein PilV